MKWLIDCRMQLAIVGFIAAFVVGSGTSKADFVWAQKADMPTPRWKQTSAVVNGKIYVIGGETSEPDVRALSTVEQYDPVTNTWTRRADMPIARSNLPGSSAVVDGKIYVIGGDDAVSWGSPTVQEYDPSTDSWTQKGDMPTSRWSLATCDVNGKIYAIGGYHSDSWVGLRTLEVYDPATDTWTRKADMPLGVALLNTRVVRGKIYAVGGRPGIRSEPWVQEYNPATDTWTRKVDMPVGTSCMGSVVFGDKIIVIGGWLWSVNYPYRTIQMYDPEADTWTIEGDAPFLRANFSADVVNNRIYAIGGTDRPHSCPALSTVYEFGSLLDFNWDGIVDSSDMCKLIDHWQTDNLLYDIAPLPFGDGIVNVQDLIELAEHLFEEISPVELIGHWKLDEAEGDIAYNGVSYNHGVLSGNPTWHPDSGRVGGVLQFDGVDDYISTDFVLNPADGPFSVIVWIKGGAPGQVLVSQQAMSNWLKTDADGNLMTELKCTGRSAGYLFSETVITDGQWHRICLVWDGSNRTLYVDGVVVAEDTQHGLEGSQMGLHIGTGKAMEPGTFFSGLIDDVRIYNRAVSP